MRLAIAPSASRGSRAREPAGPPASSQKNVRQPSGRDTHHLGALIQADDLASQMLGQKARSARDIQNASGRKAANESYELRDFN